MEALKDWIAIRLDWLDTNLPQECTGIPSAIAEESVLSDHIYPNPSTGQFTVHSAADYLEVFTLDGRLLQTHDLRNQGAIFEFTIQQKGLFLCVFHGAGQVDCQRVVVE